MTWVTNRPNRDVPAPGTSGASEAGENLAGLYSFIATCEANGVNPVEYLADLLIRMQTHPASRIDELPPHDDSRPVRIRDALMGRSAGPPGR